MRRLIQSNPVRLFVPFFIITLISAAPRTAQAAVGQWQPWEYMGNGVSISFCQVDRTTFTWKFRNDDSTRTISTMNINITDSTGTHSDCIPSPLRPGQAFGGWACYTAVVDPGQRVVVQITNITWQ